MNRNRWTIEYMVGIRPDTVRRWVSRRLLQLGKVYKREILAEEGYPLGLIWCRVEELAPEDVPNVPGVLVTALSNGSVRSVVAANSLRLQFSVCPKPDAARVALIETGDIRSARSVARRLQEEAGLRQSSAVPTNGP
jgi:hypothetical protein